MYVSEKLDAGTVFINTYNKTDVAAPFGGVKQSGFGKDLGMNMPYLSTAHHRTVCFMLHATLLYCFKGHFLHGSWIWAFKGTHFFQS